MKQIIACPSCGRERAITNRHAKTVHECGSCSRTRVWQHRRVASVAALVRRLIDLTPRVRMLLVSAGPIGSYGAELDGLDRDLAQLANDVMVASLTPAHAPEKVAL